MVKQLVVIGDSFCHGIGTVSDFYSLENTTQAFGKHLSDQLGYDYVNLAEPGSNIMRAAQRGYEYVVNNKDKIGLVIAGWTHPHRIGFYSSNAVLQILPEFVFLGDYADSDVFIEQQRNVKFITDKQYQQDLSNLPWLHKLLIGGGFINEQIRLCQMTVDSFRAWMREQKINYLDFNVFPGGVTGSKSTVTFEDVMDPHRHPTVEEQKLFADLLIKDLYE